MQTSIGTFQARRRKLMERLPNGVIIVPTANEYIRNQDCSFPFRPDSSFWYLTGFPEPEAVLVLVPEQNKSILFCRAKDPERQIWTGKRFGPEGAKEKFGFDEAHQFEKLDEVIPSLLVETPILYLSSNETEWRKRAFSWIDQARTKKPKQELPWEIKNAKPAIAEMRLFKNMEEIITIRRATMITAEAHRLAMRTCRPYQYEYELETVLVNEFRKCGGSLLSAYSPIVASGNNACTLHYIENCARIEDGDLVLIDAGCEYEWYAADVTRTFPASRKFSPEQKAIYEIVLAAQEAAIQKIRPAYHVRESQDAAFEVITRGLMELQILKGNLSSLMLTETYKKFMPHNIGHWLGLDVHDEGDYKIDNNWRALWPGMVLTVEPGIYIPRGMESVDQKWHGIGIRIEDDVVVTPSGNEVLTSGAPKSVKDIEALRS